MNHRSHRSIPPRSFRPRPKGRLDDDGSLARKAPRCALEFVGNALATHQAIVRTTPPAAAQVRPALRAGALLPRRRARAGGDRAGRAAIGPPPAANADRVALANNDRPAQARSAADWRRAPSRREPGFAL